MMHLARDHWRCCAILSLKNLYIHELRNQCEWHVCTYFIAFPTVIPNTDMKVDHSDFVIA